MRDQLQRRSSNGKEKFAIALGYFPQPAVTAYIFTNYFGLLIGCEGNDYWVVRFFRLSDILRRKLAEPDISISDRIAVILKRER